MWTVIRFSTTSGLLCCVRCGVVWCGVSGGVCGVWMGASAGALLGEGGGGYRLGS